MRKLVALLLLACTVAHAQVGPGSPSHFLAPSNAALGTYATEAALETAWPASQLGSAGPTAYILDGTGPVYWNGSAWAAYLTGTAFNPAIPGPIGGTTSSTGAFTTLTSQGSNVPYVLAQTALPVIIPPSGFMANNGQFVIGQAPNTSATATFAATSGSTTVTFSAANLLGTAVDVGRVVTILDTTYKYFTITAQSSTTVATGTISGGALSKTTPFANNVVWLSGAPTANTTAFSVPFDQIYASGCLDFPAGAIASGSAAGVYYVVMVSTTQGQVFNNVCSSQQPAIPASPTAFSTTGPGAYTQSTSAQVAISIVIPANAMGANGETDLDYSIVYNNSSGTKGISVTYGGTLISATTPTTTTASSTQIKIRNEAQTGVQSIAATTGTTAISNVVNHTANDTTTALPLNVRLALTTQPTDWSALEGYSVLIRPN